MKLCCQLMLPCGQFVLIARKVSWLAYAFLWMFAGRYPNACIQWHSLHNPANWHANKKWPQIMQRSLRNSCLGCWGWIKFVRCTYSSSRSLIPCIQPLRHHVGILIFQFPLTLSLGSAEFPKVKHILYVHCVVNILCVISGMSASLAVCYDIYLVPRHVVLYLIAKTIFVLQSCPTLCNLDNVERLNCPAQRHGTGWIF